MSTILDTQNTDWGFWGTMGGSAAEAWPVAFAAIHAATGAEPEAVRAFLDSSHGRHFADEVQNAMHYGDSLADAIANTVARWMDWRIGRGTSRATGIPVGLPYLTGFVVHEGIIAEAAGED